MSIEDSNWFGAFNTVNVHNLTGRVDADHPEITLKKDATGAYRLTSTHIQGKNHLIYVSVDSFHQEPIKIYKTLSAHQAGYHLDGIVAVYFSEQTGTDISQSLASKGVSFAVGKTGNLVTQKAVGEITEKLGSQVGNNVAKKITSYIPGFGDVVKTANDLNQERIANEKMIKDGETLVKALKEDRLGISFDLSVNIITREHAAESQLVLHPGSKTEERLASFNKYIEDNPNVLQIKDEKGNSVSVTNVTLEDVLNHPNEVHGVFREMNQEYFEKHFNEK